MPSTQSTSIAGIRKHHLSAHKWNVPCRAGAQKKRIPFTFLAVQYVYHVLIRIELCVCVCVCGCSIVSRNALEWLFHCNFALRFKLHSTWLEWRMQRTSVGQSYGYLAITHVPYWNDAVSLPLSRTRTHSHTQCTWPFRFVTLNANNNNNSNNVRQNYGYV